MADERIDPGQEYNTLRQELLEAKRYVFERPLAITALGAIGLQVFDKPQHVALPVAVALLTLFNFWFTVNRLQSAARICAYIQLVLEPSATHRWEGWETSLRQYRTWLKSLPTPQASKHVDTLMVVAAAPDALMYYPPVYYFHCALMLFSALGGLVQFSLETAVWSRTLSLGAGALAAWSIVYLSRWRPSRLRLSIERNRVIWLAVLKDGALPEDDKTTAASA
jgi:uncharacterized membrane protein